MIIISYSKVRHIGGYFMKDKSPRYTLRISRKLLDKMQYAASYEGRSVNKQIEQLIIRYLANFQEKHGEITEELIQEMYSGEE